MGDWFDLTCLVLSGVWGLNMYICVHIFKELVVNLLIIHLTVAFLTKFGLALSILKIIMGNIR